MSNSYKLSALAITLAASGNAFSALPINTNTACTVVGATDCVQSAGGISIVTDDNSFNSAGQGFRVYNGTPGSDQIETIYSDRSGTTIQTNNGNTITVNNSGTSIHSSNYDDSADTGARILLNNTGVAIDADGGNRTQFLASGVQFNNQILNGVSDGAVNSNSKEAINGSQLFLVQGNLQNQINTLGGMNILGVSANNDGTSWAIGTTSKTDGVKNTAVGNLAEAKGPNSTSVGSESYAENHGTAVGYLSQSKGLASAAYGDQAKAQANKTVAIGFLSEANADSSVALGAGSIADRVNTISIGAIGAERQITNVAAGTADTDAVNVSQLNAKAAETLATANTYTDQKAVTTLASANNYTDQKVGTIQASINNIGGNITNLQGNITRLDGRIDTEKLERIEGDAATLASANIYTEKQVGAERNARINADNALDTRVTKNSIDITENKAAIAKEVTDRQVAMEDEAKARITADNLASADRTAIRSEMNQGDIRTLAQSKVYTDQRIDKLETHYQAAIASSVAIASLPQPTEAGGSMVSAGLGQWESETGYAIGVSGVSENNKWVYKAAGTGNSRGNWGGGVSFGFQWK